MGATRVKPGQCYGRLRVLRQTGKTDGGTLLWECQCECGNLTKVRSSSLTRIPGKAPKGGVKSCGCLTAECARRSIVANRMSRWTKKKMEANKFVPVSQPLQPGERPRTLWQSVPPWD